MNTKDPKFVKNTLAWCNRMRAIQSMDRLTRLPLGTPGDPHSCPCGKATNLSVYKDRAFGGDELEGGSGIWTKPPPSVVDFIDAFDGRLLPQYEEYS